jgi:hypothetical protein
VPIHDTPQSDGLTGAETEFLLRAGWNRERDRDRVLTHPVDLRDGEAPKFSPAHRS